MIGDVLTADVLGANQLGMYSIWLTRRADVPQDGELPAQPRATIKTLDELPLLLQELELDIR